MNLERTLNTILGYLDADDLHNAEKLLKPVQAVRRNDPVVLFLAGCIAYRKSDYALAIHTMKKVLRAEPMNQRARLILGMAMTETDLVDEAVKQLTKVIVADPSNHVAYYTLGKAQWKLRRAEDARQAYLKSIALNPQEWRAYYDLALICKERDETRDAFGYFRQAIAVAPPAVRELIWNSMFDLPEMYEQALEMIKRNEVGDSVPTIYRLMLQSCRWDLVASLRDKVYEYVENKTMPLDGVHSLLLLVNYRGDFSDNQIYDMHRFWGERVGRQETRLVGDQYVLPDAGKLRIGYISGDFRQHSVAYFISNVIAAHDRKRFEIFCYATVDEFDEMTRQISNAAHAFIQVHAMNNRERAERIYRDGINILVDLSGHTLHSALGAFVYRPAPVQMTYLGYPNTTGLPQVDYRISDPYADTENGTIYTEELIKMPESFLCFGSFDERPLRQTPICHDHGYITFASFNDINKLSEDVIRIWSEILFRVPDSRLMIKAKNLSWKHVRENLLSFFAQRGIGADRLIVLGPTAERVSHLDLYNEVDIALDTFPYGGTTTTCEALWMGVPVITLVGNRHAQRVSYSLLENIGIEDTIAWSEQEYIDIAVKLATDMAQLQSLRSRLPAAIRGSILCDTPRFTRQLESLYCETWQRKGYKLPF